MTDTCVLESTKDDKWFDELKPQGFVRGRPTAECMDDTREDIMVKIDAVCTCLAGLRLSGRAGKREATK